MSDGHIVLAVEIDEKSIKSGIKNVSNMSDSLSKKFGSVSDAVSAALGKGDTKFANLIKNFSTLNNKIVFQAKKVEELKQRYAQLQELQNLESTRGELGSQKIETEKQISGGDDTDQTRAKYEALKTAINDTDIAIQNLRTDLGLTDTKIVNDEIEKTSDNLTKAKVKLDELGKAGEIAGKKVSAGLKKSEKGSSDVSKRATAAASGFGKMGAQIGSLIKTVFIFNVIRKALTAIKDAVSDVIKRDSGLQKSFEELKNSVNYLFSGIVNTLVIPALKVVIAFLQKVVDAVYQLVSLLTGKSVEALKKEAKAFGEVSKAAKKATNNVAAYDEINQFQKDTGTTDSEIQSSTALPSFKLGVDVDEDKLETAKNKIIDAFSKAKISVENTWNTLEPFFSQLWDRVGKDVTDKASQWSGQIIDATGESFDHFSDKLEENQSEIQRIFDVIIGIAEVIWDIVKAVIGSIVDDLGQQLNNTIDLIFSLIGVVGNFFGMFKNIIMAFVELFKGNTDESVKYFKKAWANFVNFWVSIGNSIITILNGLWIAIFASIKGIVNAIGGIVKTIGGWFGQDDWGWEWTAKAPLIPLIPKYVPELASGAVLPANQPFLAMLGDQKSGKNLEAPEGLIRDIVNDGNQETNRLLHELIYAVKEGHIITADGKAIARTVNKANSEMGTNMISGGYAYAY